GVRVRRGPPERVLTPGQQHRAQMMAEYSSGTQRDVPRLGIFTVNNPQFATVDDEGLVVAGDAGETAIVARFERTFAATGVIVLAPRENFAPTPVPQSHLVDWPVVEKLNMLRRQPAPMRE